MSHGDCSPRGVQKSCGDSNHVHSNDRTPCHDDVHKNKIPASRTAGIADRKSGTADRKAVTVDLRAGRVRVLGMLSTVATSAGTGMVRR